MTKSEFMDKLRIAEKLADNNHVFTYLDLNSKHDEIPEVPEISNEDYSAIEMVYTYHPAIDAVHGKMQIAQIFAYGGMGVIKDMMPTAAKARQIETELRAVNAKKRNLVAQLEALKTGKEAEEVIME